MTTSQPQQPPAPGAATRQWFRVARPDTMVLIITGFFLVSLLYFSGQVALGFYLGGPLDRGDLVFALVVGGVILWRWLVSVRGYLVETGGPAGPRFRIVRMAPWAAVPVAVERLRSAEIQTELRILNTNLLSQGSVFGWSGAALVPGIGPVLAFATSRRSPVLLELAPRPENVVDPGDGKPPRGPMLLLSPRDPAGLVAALQPLCLARPRPAVSVLAAKPPRPATPAPARKKRR